MYVVIPTAVEPRNPSLSYALASIRKYTTYTPVTVGHDYGLCDHIPSPQLAGRANIFTNTDRHMQTALRELGEPFIWSADDIYWLEPAEPVRWAIGHLEDATGNTIYARRKRATAAWLRQRFHPTHDYEAHVPMLVDPGPMIEVLDLILRLGWSGLDKRSLYGNLTGQPDHVAPDVKLRQTGAPLPDTPWVSTHHDPGLYRNLRHDLAAL